MELDALTHEFWMDVWNEIERNWDSAYRAVARQKQAG